MNYNKIALTYDDFEQNAVTLWRIGYPAVCKYLHRLEGKSVLDYGCGSGTFSRYLREQGADVTGVDTSRNMIRIAKQSEPNDIVYRQIHSGNIDFLTDTSFDAAVTNFVLCTLSSRKKIKMIMESIHRVLRKNGRFIIMNANWEKSNGREFVSYKLEYCNNLHSGQQITPLIKSDPPIILKDYYWSKEDYLELLEESGFQFQDSDEPLGLGNDFSWLDEKKFPPYIIISVKKGNNRA